MGSHYVPLWCSWEGGSRNPPSPPPPQSRSKFSFDPTEQGRGLEPQAKLFCTDGIMFCRENMRPTPNVAFGTVCNFASRAVWVTSHEYMQTTKGLLNWDIDHTS